MVEQNQGPSLEDDAGPVLLFRLDQRVYAIPVRDVNEIVLLPELMPLDDRPPYFIGVANLRGAIVPVMDLRLRMGRTAGPYSVDDYLLIFEHAGKLVAFVANETLGVHELGLPESRAQNQATLQDTGAECVQRVITIDETIVMLLNLDGVLAPPVEATNEEGNRSVRGSEAEASDDDRTEFRRRAKQLSHAASDETAAACLPFAVAEISQEYFAFDLRFVREFAEMQRISRVPCCPQHIVGNANVRGDVLIVIDIRHELNLPRLSCPTSGKIIVAQTEELVVGLLVDELHGVVYHTAADPAGDSTESAISKQVVKDTVSFRDRMMCILDLPALLTLTRWVVDEEVSHV